MQQAGSSRTQVGAAETPSDIIIGARGVEPVVKESTMPPPMQQHAIERTRQAIREQAHFPDVLKDVRTEFEASYGGSWHCVVAEEPSSRCVEELRRPPAPKGQNSRVCPSGGSSEWARLGRRPTRTTPMTDGRTTRTERRRRQKTDDRRTTDDDDRR